MTNIFFVRHGKVRNPLGLFYGRSFGFPLDESGRTQAKIAGKYLRDKSIDIVYSSPQLRACETAEIILGFHKHLVLRISDWLNEVYCPFDGQPIEIAEKREFDVYTGVGLEFEQPEDVLARARKFIFGVLTGHNGQNIVAVSHGDLIAFLLLWANRIECKPVNKTGLYKKYLKPGSIFIFSFETKEKVELPKVQYVDLEEGVERDLKLEL